MARTTHHRIVEISHHVYVRETPEKQRIDWKKEVGKDKSCQFLPVHKVPWDIRLKEMARRIYFLDFWIQPIYIIH